MHIELTSITQHDKLFLVEFTIVSVEERGERSVGRAVALFLLAIGMMVLLFSFRPVLGDSISLENKENFSIDYSTYDDGSLVGSGTGYNLTAGDALLVSWKGNSSSAPSPPCVYLLDDYQFHGWDYVRKYALLDPASRGYLWKKYSWEMNVTCTINLTDTYHVIIDNTNWVLSVTWPKISMVSYQAVQNYPDSYYLAVKTDPMGIASIQGENWYSRGYNKILTAPYAVTINASFQYRFQYWDVDNVPSGTGINPVTVRMSSNRTATAHYIPYELLEHDGGFSIRFSTRDPHWSTPHTLIGSINGYSVGAGERLLVSWNIQVQPLGSTPYTYLLDSYQIQGWYWSNFWNQGIASYGYLRLVESWQDTIDFQVTSSDTYYVIISNRNPSMGIAGKTPIDVISYDAYLALPESYYLSVRTEPLGITTIDGQGWYMEGASPLLTAPATVSASPTSQYVFDYWDVDGTSQGMTINPISVGMNTNHTATAHYVLQYQISFVQNGLDSSAVGSVLSVNSIPKSFSNLPYTLWKNTGSIIAYSYNPTVPSDATAKQFALKNVSGPSSPITIAGPTTVTGYYRTQYQMVFNQTGVGNDFSGTIVTIDTTEYGYNTLPTNFWWDMGSTHTFVYQSTLLVTTSAKQYVWIGTSGLSTLQSDSITVTAPGNLIGNYKTQYYLTVNSPYDTPTPTSGWFDDGNSITASVTSPWSGSTGTRYICTGWSGTGSVPVSGGSQSTAFVINQASSIAWNWKTQHYLTVRTDPLGVTSIPGEGWYDSAASVTLTAPSVQNYTFGYWDVDGTSQGNGTKPITTTMNAPHVATAHYAYSTPLTVHIQPTLATISLGQSVTFTSTVSGGKPPYSYQWYLDNNPVSGATSDRWIFTPSTTGIYYVFLKVTDSSSTIAQSETAKVTVVSVPVGGYSVSFDKYRIVKPMAFNFAIVMVLAGFFVAVRRKTRRP
jgi:hypothetical protein